MNRSNLLVCLLAAVSVVCVSSDEGDGKARDTGTNRSSQADTADGTDTGDQPGDTGSAPIAPALTLSTTLIDFGPLDYGGEAQLSLELENTGNEDLELTQALLETGTVFSVSALEAATLPPGSTTTLTVTFQPDAGASFTDRLLVQSNDPANPTQFAMIAGVGLLATIDLSPSELDFGTVYLGCTETAGVAVSNPGNGDLTVSAIDLNSASGEFSVDTAELGDLPWTVSPGTSLQLPVRYTPTAELPNIAYLFVDSSDPFTPQVVALFEATGELYDRADDRFEQGRTPTDTFSLSQAPVPSTIAVSVNGVYTTVGWAWDEATNSVVFDAAEVPVGGAAIRIQYAVKGPC
ncbi:MAG TPA: hypothetical protein DFR83_24860 [Deltaproteobacteria bacterium]|nr:hypothetical protein [Deltaproteobacteria bacterium]